MVALAPLLGTFALNAAPSLLNSLIGNDAANRQKEQQKQQLKLAHHQKRMGMINSYSQAIQRVNMMNDGIVAAYTDRVNTFQTNLGILGTQESMAYESAMRQTSEEVSQYLVENLDLMKSYVQSSGRLAAMGINNQSAQLQELKNGLGGYLTAQRNLKKGVVNDLKSIGRTIDKVGYMAGLQRDAMYAPVKKAPQLMQAPTMGALPRWKTPSAFKQSGLKFSDVAPGLISAGFSAFKSEVVPNLFSGGGGDEALGSVGSYGRNYSTDTSLLAGW